MADITMCEGYDCPLKIRCRRYTANPSEGYQSYFLEDPRRDPSNHPKMCEYFWSTEPFTGDDDHQKSDGELND